MDFQEWKKQQEAEAAAWEVEHSNDPLLKEGSKLEMEHNILFNSMVQEIAIAEAADTDTWEDGDNTQSWLEQGGSQDVTGLPHWQGKRKLDKDVVKSGITPDSWRGMFIQSKFDRREARMEKARTWNGIEFVLQRTASGKMKVRDALPTDLESKEKRQARISAKLAKLDRGAAVNPKQTKMQRRMAAAAARQAHNA